jgi:hypothetical protein
VSQFRQGLIFLSFRSAKSEISCLQIRNASCAGGCCTFVQLATHNKERLYEEEIAESEVG